MALVLVVVAAARHDRKSNHEDYSYQSKCERVAFALPSSYDSFVVEYSRITIVLTATKREIGRNCFFLSAFFHFIRRLPDADYGRRTSDRNRHLPRYDM